MNRAVLALLAVSVAGPTLAADGPGIAGPEERRVMEHFGECVAEHSAEKAREVLNRDFQSTQYRNGLRNLARNNEGCFANSGYGRMRATGLPFAAAIAEALIEADDTPLNIRLARAGQGKVAATYSPTDALAMCVARSLPDDVARLFASEIGSQQEEAAAAALAPAIRPCTPAGFVSESGPAGLRASIATASFRLLAAQES